MQQPELGFVENHSDTGCRPQRSGAGSEVGCWGGVDGMTQQTGPGLINGSFMKPCRSVLGAPWVLPQSPDASFILNKGRIPAGVGRSFCFR